MFRRRSSSKTVSTVLSKPPLYRHWQGLYLSFYSSRFYVDVGTRWQGLGLLYLLIMLAVAMAPFSARVILDVRCFFEEKLFFPLKALPELTIESGALRFNEPMPYVIKDSSGHVVSAIDTTGRIQYITKKHPDLTYLFTTDHLAIRSPSFKLFFLPDEVDAPLSVENISFKNIEHPEVFNGQAFVDSKKVQLTKYVTEILTYPVITMFSFGLYMVLLLPLAFVGKIISITMFQYRISMEKAYRMLTVTSTVSILPYLLLTTLGITFPGMKIGYLTLLMVYFCYAILVLRRDSRQLSTMVNSRS